VTGGARTRVHVVLVKPHSAANVGAVARVVRNTGMASLRLVQPGDWRVVECWRSAWGAQDVLEQAQVFDDLRSALAGAAYVVALSGRAAQGLPPLDVRDAALEVAALEPTQEACLVFGPEPTGLNIEELLLCGRTARIPSHPDQPSLNLSHAVMVACYEVFRAPAPASAGPGPRITHDRKEALLELWFEGLRAVEAVPHGDERTFREWRSFLGRIDLGPRELRLLEHLARKLARRR
jgi:TrmH family RNA methyltransferase